MDCLTPALCVFLTYTFHSMSVLSLVFLLHGMFLVCITHRPLQHLHCIPFITALLIFYLTHFQLLFPVFLSSLFLFTSLAMFFLLLPFLFIHSPSFLILHFFTFPVPELSFLFNVTISSYFGQILSCPLITPSLTSSLCHCNDNFFIYCFPSFISSCCYF